MDFEEFIQRVLERAGLETREQAERATRVTLETLGERMYRTERDNLAAQLPNEIKPFLFRRQKGEATRTDVDRFPLEEFYNRVSARAEIGYPEAVRQAGAVASVLQEAVSPAQLGAVRQELSDDYGELFEIES